MRLEFYPDSSDMPYEIFLYFCIRIIKTVFYGLSNCLIVMPGQWYRK